MPYVIRTTYKPGHDALRDRLLREHVEYLDAHAGQLLAAGGLVADDNCSVQAAMYILAVEEREAAQRFVDEEPFVRGGLISQVFVERWRKSYFNGERLLGDPMRTSSAAINSLGSPPLSVCPAKCEPKPSR